MKAQRSLKARALQLLAQRDQSRVELRIKLLAHARAAARQAEAALAETVVEGTRAVTAGVEAWPPEQGPASVPPIDAAAPVGSEPPAVLAVQVDEVLAWLEEKRFLSTERFAESRVSSRSARFGNRRIQQELARHDVTLSPEAAQALVDSELERARAVRARKFPDRPTTAPEHARQARFLAARGFSADVIRRALRDAARGGDGGD